MSQHQKIIDMCSDWNWHCQSEFWLRSKSPHKRRIEIEGRKNVNEPITGDYYFEERRCEHGISGSKDFRMHRTEPLPVHLPSRPPQVMPKYAVDIIQKQLTLKI